MGEVQLTIHSNFQDVIDKINKLDTSVENLNKDIAESGRVSKQAYDTATREAEQFNQAQVKNQQTVSKSMQMFSKFGMAIGAAFSVTAVLAFGKAVVSSTDAGADAMERFREGIKGAFTFLKQSLATMDFSNLIQGFRNAYEAGKEFADQMDELEERRRALSSQTKDIDLAIIGQRTLARNRSLDVADRKAAIEEIIRLEELKLTKTKEITSAELKAQLDYAAVNKQLSQQEILDLVTNYDKYSDQLREGAELEIYLNDQVTKSRRASNVPGTFIFLTTYEEEFAKLNETQQNSIRLNQEYNKVVKEQRDAILAASNADKDATISMASAEESLQRIRNGLYSEFIAEEKKKQDIVDESIKQQKELAELTAWTYENQKELFADDEKAALAYAEAVKKVKQAFAELVDEYRDETNVDDIPFDTEAIKKQIDELNQWAEDNSFWASLGFENQEQLDQAKDMASQIYDVVQGIVDAQVEASERLVDDLNNRIDEQEELVNREFELKKEGLGNNYALEQENLVKMQQARDQAIKDREKNIRIQRTLSTIEASISLIVAAANIMKGFSSIPIVGVALGILAVGAMIAAFVAAQSKAKDVTQMAKGGQLRGLRHSEGGISIPGTGIEVEGGEYVANRQSTQKYLPLLEAINKDDREAMKLFFNRNFIKQLPASFNSGIDYRPNFNEVVRQLKKGKSDIIYGNGFIIEKSGGYTKKINLN